MSSKPNMYLNGKIYKIVCNLTGETYIGSTTKEYLTRRLTGHRMQYKQYLKDKKNYASSFRILERDDYNIDLVEITPCNSRDELLKKERERYDKIENINMMRPFVSEDEKKTENKIRKQTENKIRKKTEEYKQHAKKYHETEAYKEKNKTRKQTEKYKEQINCECDSCYKLSGKNIHLKTKRHQEFERIKQQNNNYVFVYMI